MEIIRSVKNSKVKLIRSLKNKKGREETGLYLAEGYNIIKDLPSNIEVKELFVRESDSAKYKELTDRINAPCAILADFVFDSAGDTVNSNGILALLPIPKEREVSGDIVLVLDGIRDAGNMGTIIRTGAAMGALDIIAVDSVDFFSPKVVRSTMGGIFHTNLLARKDYQKAIELLDGYSTVFLDMEGRDVFSFPPPKKLAIVVGSETLGVSKELREISKASLSIDMPVGKIESLNAAVSISIALAAVINNKKTK